MSTDPTGDEKFFELRESGYTGWIDQDGNPVEDLDLWIADQQTGQ